MAVLKTYEQAEIVAGNATYTVTKFPATRGVKYITILRKVFAPAFIKAASNEGTTFLQIFESISDNLDSLDEELIKEIICVATGITPSNFDFEFSGNYMGLFVLLKEILIFNYKDVFIELGLGDLVGE